MRSLLSLSLWAAAGLVGLANAATLTSRECVAEICSNGGLSGRSDVTLTSELDSRALTNAERLARGLSPNPPSKRRGGIAARTQPSATPKITLKGVIQVFSGDTSLGYVAPDPNYWTPLLTPDINSALSISFQLAAGATSASDVAFTQLNDNRGTFFGPVVGRDSTSSNIAPGSFNYLYLDPIAAPGTAPGATPQSVPSFFATSSGLDKQAESSVWAVDLITGAITAQWINTDSSTPATVLFVQSNHLYAGGDAGAFHSRFPAPVLVVSLKFIPTI